MIQPTKPTAYLLCGFIGSGKTTFARQLEKETGAARFTKDEWMVKLFGNQPPKETFPIYDAKMTELVTEMALKCLVAGGSIILDDGFWYRKQRDEIRLRLKDIEAETILYYIDTQIEVMRERTVKRSEHPSADSFYITDDEFNDYISMFEPPSAEEEFIRIKNYL